ncbi:MAG: SixA phosphatase family protein [Solirubrobacterales bacterium]
MKRLYLLRHAKSSWDLAGELDFERGLTEHGWNDCALMAELIQERGIVPDIVICSGATRARETLRGVAKAFPLNTLVEYEDAVYRATTEDLLEVLHEVPAKHEAVMLIGHNTSVHDLAVEISRESEELVRVATKFPTAALAEFEVDGEWADLGEDSAELTHFTRPKQLRQGERETL